jgi:hypothetical protein
MLAHFIQDIPEIGYDHDEIYIELCDLVASKGKHETLRRGGGGHKGRKTNKSHSSQ